MFKWLVALGDSATIVVANSEIDAMKLAAETFGVCFLDCALDLRAKKLGRA